VRVATYDEKFLGIGSQITADVANSVIREYRQAGYCVTGCWTILCLYHRRVCSNYRPVTRKDRLLSGSRSMRLWECLFERNRQSKDE
jgi:hypothetical protein